MKVVFLFCFYLLTVLHNLKQNLITVLVISVIRKTNRHSRFLYVTRKDRCMPKKQKQKDDNQVILLQYNSYDPEMNTRNQDFSKSYNESDLK